MQKSLLTLKPKSQFNFISTINAHGWVALAPFKWDPQNSSLSRVEELKSRVLVWLDINYKNSINIKINHIEELNEKDKTEIKTLVIHMLRLDEDFTAFFRMCEKYEESWVKIGDGKGRLLRSPSVFEDLVKTICTTNIQWGDTKRMIKELVDVYGCSFNGDPELKSFAKAQAIASDSFEDFNKKVNLGYRVDYIYQLALNVANEKIDLNSFLDPHIPTPDLKKKLLAIKGIGNYAAATMLMLLGRYDELPIDSVFKEFVSKKYFIGKKYSEKKAQKIYQKWGKWQYLAYWFDLEQD